MSLKSRFLKLYLIVSVVAVFTFAVILIFIHKDVASYVLSSNNVFFTVLHFIFIFVIYSLVPFVVSIFFLGKYIIKPVKAIEKYSNKIRDEKCYERLDIDADEEFLSLVGSLNDMTQGMVFIREQLENSNSYLEDKVEQRTAELQDNIQKMNKEIRERILAEDALRDKEIILTSIFESSSEAVMVIDNHRRIVDSNRKFVELFGLTKEDENLPLDEIMEKMDIMIESPVGWSFLENIFSKEFLEEPQVLVLKDKRVLQFFHKPMIVGETYVYGKILNFHDITALKTTEQERIQLEQDLQQAQKLESMGTLAAGIAHEMNTPIQYVKDNTEFLNTEIKNLIETIGFYQKMCSEYGEFPEEVIESLHKKETEIDLEYILSEIPSAISESIEGLNRVAKIVNAMKSYSHIDTQDKSLMDVNKAVESTTIICRNEWKYVADLDLDLDENLPLLKCFQHDVQQMVMNLVVNAAHAIESKGDSDKGKITVSTSFNNEYVIISVQDSGTGIPDSIKDKIFDPFFTTKEVGKGTGQGLSLVYNVVDSHGGKISIETKDGEGSKFIINLPIDK